MTAVVKVGLILILVLVTAGMAITAGKEYPPEVTEIIEKILKEDSKVDIQSLNSSEEIEFLNNYINPVTKIVKALKAKGLNDTEITEILEKYNMGWDPKTGAAWRESEKLSEKELSSLKPFYPSKEQSSLATTSTSQRSYQANQVMETRENNVDLANEVWSDTGSYTDDIGEAKHDDPFLYAGEYGMWWDDSIPTDWWHAPVNGCPVKERHQMEGSSYAYWTWVD